MMQRRLPNLNQLRAFEAAARLGSFKAAASELHVTQAAISHQIKALEEALGLPLFRRTGRSVALLEDAGPYASMLRDVFDKISEATSEIAAEPAGPIRISAAPFHGNRWLMPKLDVFSKAHPEIPVDASLAFELVDLTSGEVDAAIRYGEGDWPGHDARLIHEDLLRPIATRGLIGDRKLPLEPEEIAQLPLLDDPNHEGHWPLWFEAAGYDGPIPARRAFAARAFVVDAVMSGHGAHLLDVRMSARNVAEGQLVYLSDITVNSGKGFWMVRATSTRHDPRLDQLTDWLCEAAKAES